MFLVKAAWSNVCFQLTKSWFNCHGTGPVFFFHPQRFRPTYSFSGWRTQCQVSFQTPSEVDMSGWEEVEVRQKNRTNKQGVPTFEDTTARTKLDVMVVSSIQCAQRRCGVPTQVTIYSATQGLPMGEPRRLMCSTRFKRKPRYGHYVPFAGVGFGSYRPYVVGLGNSADCE